MANRYGPWPNAGDGQHYKGAGTGLTSPLFFFLPRLSVVPSPPNPPNLLPIFVIWYLYPVTGELLSGVITIGNPSCSILGFFPHPNPNPKMESQLGGILDRMEVRLLEIIVSTEDKHRAY
jgi:hypothetical protein